jgi:hypothetical protein
MPITTLGSSGQLGGEPVPRGHNVSWLVHELKYMMYIYCCVSNERQSAALVSNKPRDPKGDVSDSKMRSMSAESYPSACRVFPQTNVP